MTERKSVVFVKSKDEELIRQIEKHAQKNQRTFTDTVRILCKRALAADQATAQED